ncbi:MAG: DUF4260 domain-containing protein [Saprospiraceae bacterium]|nr:DUF4260 domain-containing protein [Saprospiraceae bacterium]
MKNLLKLEEFGLLLLFALMYFHLFPGSVGFYAALFFAPDLAFVLYLISPKAGSMAYNTTHHKGLIAVLIVTGFLLPNDLLLKVGLIFMAHSCFDRVLGYGLKYADDFGHTHLGWIGKSAERNFEK